MARAATVVPEGQSVIEAIAVARDGLYVRDMDGGYSALRRLGNDGRLQSVALPVRRIVRLDVDRARAQDGVWLLGTSWLLPFTGVPPRSGGRAARWRYRCAPACARSIRRPIEAIRSFATARDGTKVPLSIVARKGLKRDGRNPTLVNAYGAYQISTSPYFNARGIAFLEQGGVLAYAHVRGGGEYGKRWWKAGQKITKPNTWRDLIDCCEELVKRTLDQPEAAGDPGRLGRRHHGRPRADRAARSVRRGDLERRRFQHAARRVLAERPAEHRRVRHRDRAGRFPRASSRWTRRTRCATVCATRPCC